MAGSAYAWRSRDPGLNRRIIAMKPNKQIPIIVLALMLGACATVQTGSDPVVVRAEQTVALAKATFQFAVDTEKQSRATLVQINYSAALQIKHTVDVIRLNAGIWQAAAVNEIKAYKANANNANFNALQKALADISTGMSQAQNVINQINQTKGGNP